MAKTTLQSRLTGKGQSFASFGEVIQGRLSSGDDFLVTLPVDLWSTCYLTCTPLDGRSVVNTEWVKSKAVTQQLLVALGMECGVSVDLVFERGMPIGKGLSASTADMLAVIRAFQDAFAIEMSGLDITDNFISYLFARIEPHDALHYPMSTVYNHRQGKLLKKLHYVPDFRIVAIDNGGECSTLEYNKGLRYTPQLMQSYDALYQQLLAAFERRDDVAIAQCAKRSVELHVSRTGHPFLAQVIEKSAAMDILGILATHSGTCCGLLLPGDVEQGKFDMLVAEVNGLGRVFSTRTLQG